MLNHRPRNSFALLAIAVALVHPACSTKAVGVEECRRVEYARCEAAPNCPEQFSVSDVGLCKLFYRDHCLHGLPVATAPNAAVVNQCITAIEDLSSCAAEAGPDTQLADCAVAQISTDPRILTTCKLLAQPDAIRECAFLAAGTASSGGQGGAGGSGGSVTTGAGGTTTGGTTTGGTTTGGTTTGGQTSIGDLLGIGGLTL